MKAQDHVRDNESCEGRNERAGHVTCGPGHAHSVTPPDEPPDWTAAATAAASVCNAAAAAICTAAAAAAAAVSQRTSPAGRARERLGGWPVLDTCDRRVET
jgi:hypothetical protein